MLKTDLASLKIELTGKGLRPSYPRVKVLEYLRSMPGHPTVDEVFSALAPGMPTLSRATIYNILNDFARCGLIHVLGIDEAEMRFDIITDIHGHFKCAECGTITNFDLDMERLAVSGLDQFEITGKDVFFYGRCPECKKKKI